MAKPIGVIVAHRKTPAEKRTSQGVDNRPKNKHTRKNWKRYRGQGRV
jgi:hypothetical protein